jgi:deazaflavin-dependent oxidoreductase (nitroreductase family)
MDERILEALQRERTIDITTTGRQSGRPRRIEIWFHNLDGRLYITGSPGRRGWYANLRANPKFTFHLKGEVAADLPAMARPIVAEPERRAVLARITVNLGRQSELERWVEASPLVEVTFAKP